MLRATLCLLFAGAAVAANYPAPVEGDYIIRNYQFKSGEVLPELRLHYATIGTPQKDANGVVRNAVLIMHGTTGSGRQFLVPQFADVLFGPGQLLDATKYFIILRDAVGHGQSSKPSDGLHAKFPHYEYEDMVRLDYKLLTEKLGVNHLRLVMGTSMGGMHSWMWPELYPDFMDAAMPLASLPAEIAGRNRMWRKMIMDCITEDPAWMNGEYKSQPPGLKPALYIMTIFTSVPKLWQKEYPTREAADRFLARSIAARMKTMDANDMLYAFDSSRNYNPEPDLGKIKCPLMAVNSADDQINPPELGVMERDIKLVKRGEYVLLPITDQTRGHGTHTLPAIWQGYLKKLLAESQN
jgi:homoserine O-acetyltransferase